MNSLEKMQEEQRAAEEDFLHSVANHQMTIIRDEGLHRHIRFGVPNSRMEYFEIITWPGYLCYTGDMGTFVFQRVDDMFSFFRMKENPDNPKKLTIKPKYWSEKLQSIDRNGGFEVFDKNKFKELASEYLDTWLRRDDLTDSEKEELSNKVKNAVLEAAEDGEHRALSVAYEFSHKIRNKTFEFTDFLEHNFKSYTGQYMWCCFALVWGIRFYDAFRANAEKEGSAENPGACAS